MNPSAIRRDAFDKVLGKFDRKFESSLYGRLRIDVTPIGSVPTESSAPEKNTPAQRKQSVEDLLVESRIEMNREHGFTTNPKKVRREIRQAMKAIQESPSP